MPPRSTGGKLLAPKDWQERFLKALAETQRIDQALIAAGVGRTFAYQMRKRDPEFGERWDEVIESSTDELERVVLQRAIDGSDLLAMFLLKARRPTVYRENVHHEHEHQVSGTLTLMVDGKQPIQLNSAKRREAARALQAAAVDDVIEGTAEDLDDAATG